MPSEVVTESHRSLSGPLGCSTVCPEVSAHVTSDKSENALSGGTGRYTNGLDERSEVALCNLGLLAGRSPYLRIPTIY